MAIVIDRAARLQIRAGWPTIRRDVFIKSKAYEDLRKEILQHLVGGVAGRSFLISGHRGAGKTMLVRAVVDDLRREIFVQTENGRREPMRPLLVTLHGPTLLGESLTALGEGNAEAPQQSASDADAGSSSDPASEAAPADDLAKTPAPLSVEVNVNGKNVTKEKPKPVTDPIQNALVQIMIGLYRAVASEFAQAAVVATQEASAGRRKRGLAAGELPDLAARLRLELDSMPDTAALYDIWSRIELPRDAMYDRHAPLGKLTSADLEPSLVIEQGRGRLARGILWPTAATTDAQDLGFQEIVALATAAHAFQVCIGKVTESAKRSDSSSREEKLELAGKVGVRDLANKMLALAAGLGVGFAVGTDTHHTAGAVAGLAAALATSLTLDWSSSRSKKDERASDYTFLPDRSTQSLDRDLPLVIERIHAAGLAPIFVVDEIDKLAMPDKPLEKLIRRLKQLTTDYGFFCFLTDRDYFDLVEKRLKTEVFPVEHTFFTNRVLIAYQPDNFVEHLRSAIAVVPGPGGTASEAENLAALMLGRVITHRAQLNATELGRAIARLTDGTQTVTEPEPLIRSLEIYRLEVILQLAIEHAMRQQQISARIKASTQLAQIATDALYMISRKWYEGASSVQITPKSVLNDLNERMRLAPEERMDLSRKAGTTLVAKEDLDAFVDGLRLIANLVSDFDRLLAAFKFEPKDTLLRSIFTPPLTPLLRPARDHAFRFCWDRYGLLREEQDPTDVKTATDAVSKLIRLFEDVDLSVDDLTAGILPTSGKVLRETIARLRTPGVESAHRATDQSRITSVYELVARRGPILRMILALVQYLRRWTSCSGRDAFLAIDRYLPLTNWVELEGESLRQAFLNSLSGAGGLPRPSFSREPEPDVDDWRRQVEGLEASPPPENAASAWADWLPRLEAFFGVRAQSAPPAPPSLQDVVLAAKGEMPGSLFHRDLGELEVRDWSRLTLEGAKFDGASAPAWAVPVGLYALGFGKTLLVRVEQQLRTQSRGNEATDVAGRLAKLAPNAGPGVLDIVSRPETEAGRRALDDPPILRLRYDAIPTYVTSLEWLQDQATFDRRADDGLESLA